MGVSNGHATFSMEADMFMDSCRQKAQNTRMCVLVRQNGVVVQAVLHVILTHISLASFLLDLSKQNSPRREAAKCGFVCYDEF